VVAGARRNKVQAAAARMLPDQAKSAMQAAQTRPRDDDGS
jgi:hypothetical protein